MKLEKYGNRSKKKRKVILISLGLIVLISVSLLLYKTFASFTESAEFPMMNGKVDYFGNSDIYFVFYQGDKELEEMPQKDNEENLVFDHAECDNGASIEWNEEEWAPLVKGLNKVKTKCSLYFDEKPAFDKEVVKCGKAGTGAAECIKNNANLDTVNLMADDTSDANIRYVGATVNNYIDIGDRDGDGNPILWRIIGVMNNMTSLDNGGRQESLVKIMRSENIGNYSWDTSASEINSGYGVNEWSQADIMKLLNPSTVYSGTPEIGGSLYWNRGNGKCYTSLKEGNKDCDFTSSGLSEDAKNKIAKVRWNTGTFETPAQADTPSATYEAERGSHNGKEFCTSDGGGKYCNDEVERTTTWDGYVGLIYASDYGYAVGGDVRDTCLGVKVYDFSSNSCYKNDWLKPSGGNIWTMTSWPYISKATSASLVYSLGDAGTYDSYYNTGIMPVVYLSSSVKIIDGNGEKGTPFIAQLES